MKKLLASVLCIATVMSLAACSSKQPEPTVTTTAETTVETTTVAETSATTETTETTEVSETTESTPETTLPVRKLKDYVKNVRKKYKKAESEDGRCQVPEIVLKSAYADQVNKEIDAIMQKYIEIRKTNKKYCFCSQYMAYLHKSGILTVLFLEEPDNEEGTIYHMYNIDVTTGLKADNARMAAAAGVTDIRKAAMNAVAKLYRKNGWKIKDYKPAEKMSEANYQAVVNSFKEDRLNDNMMMGITDKGKLFFVSDIGGIYDEDGVSTDATFIYDADGKDLEYESNKNFVT